MNPKLVWNDGGKSDSKRPLQKNDCVVRAIAIAAQEPYDDIYDALAERGRKCSRTTKKDVWKCLLCSYPKAKRVVFAAEKGKPRMNLACFCEAEPWGHWVVQLAGHLCAVVDGQVHDTIETRMDACVYAAWKMPERDWEGEEQ